MDAADKLIVALDCESERADDLVSTLPVEAGVSFFKIGPQLFLDRNGYGLAERVVRLGCGLFLDLKVYDTRDTVAIVVRRAFDLGARFVTVHATPSVMEAAMGAKPAGDQCKVLAVGPMSDKGIVTSADIQQLFEGIKAADGIVCPPLILSEYLYFGGKPKWPGRIMVVPGIRTEWDTLDTDPPRTYSDNHVGPCSPFEALRLGADYIVVGRPICQAVNPVAAAKAIIGKMAR